MAELPKPIEPKAEQVKTPEVPKTKWDILNATGPMGNEK